MSLYKGEEKGEVPGILPGPPPDGDYYWGSSGLFWGGMIDYSSRTGDDTYDGTIARAIQFQRGSDDNFMPANWTASMGNDDVAIWGLAAVRAASSGFQEPGNDEPQWATLAQNAFVDLSDNVRRVQNGSCEGALRWQIFMANNGYNFVSSESPPLYNPPRDPHNLCGN